MKHKTFMKNKLLLILFILSLTHLNMNAQQTQNGHYAQVNGLKLYYEVHGKGMPLVLIHGGGSTIESNFGRVIPELAKTHQVIAVELQSHGHTADIDREMSFEQDADDVAALLTQLRIKKADILGFSNGGTTTLQLAIRHPELVNKIVVASGLTKRDGMFPGFFDMMKQATLDQMPAPLKEAYRKINPDPKGLEAMFHRDANRMIAFKDISDDNIKAIQAPALIINAQHDAITSEHALYLSRTIPHAQLLIVPGGHGDYLGEACSPDKNSKLPSRVTAMIEDFLLEEPKSNG